MTDVGFTPIQRADIERIRETVNVETVIEQSLGTQGERQGRWIAFSCPWHHDPVPSLKVDTRTNRWKCFGGCHEGRSHDIFDWFQLFYGTPLREAYFDLSGESPEIYHRKPLVEYVPPKPKPEKPKRVITLSEVKAVAGGAAALAYFNGRGITAETCQDYILGDEIKNHKIEIKGEVLGYRERHHYTIPHITPEGTISTVKCRRDDAFCRADLPDVPEEITMPVYEYLKDKMAITHRDSGYLLELLLTGNLTNRQAWQPALDPALAAEFEANVLKMVYGGRFSSWWNTSAVMFNERLVRKVLPDGEVFYPFVSQLIVVESEIEVMYLRDALGTWGYPAVAVKDVFAIDIETLFKRVRQLYIIQHNDPPKRNKVTGEVAVAGENIAQAVLRRAGRGTIIKSPVGKDANDVPQNQIRAWLTGKCGINPLPRSLL